jgi:hypothetical protein
MATKKQLTSAQTLLNQAKARQAELDALAAKAKESAANTKLELEQLGIVSKNTKPLNEMTPEELKAYQAARLADITKTRETGGGTNPPYEAPEGTHWSFIGGQWKLYKDFVTTKSSSSSGSGDSGAGSSGSSSGDSTADIITAQNQKAIDEANMLARQSAYDLLYAQFKQYGLESLVEGIKDLIKSNVSPSEFAIRLQDTEAYKKRFAANQDRIKAGLRALTPAEYIGLEDQYQNIMRNYGLPASYYTKDAMGTQAGFNKFIANDVSAAELEDRIATAQKRVLNADVNVMNALKQFYPDITNSDILAYTLDPSNALENIKRRVTAAEIGGAALGQGLMTSAASAEDLAKYGITKAQAQQGYGTIAEFLPSAIKLGDIYARQGLGAYEQGTAEQEVFGTAGAATAAQKRKKLSQLETAAFSGSSGQAQGALDRGRQGSF